MSLDCLVNLPKSSLQLDGDRPTMMLKSIADKIRQAQTILLSTHRQCDGDGLGSQIALFHALKAAGKTVRILNVDATPKKYAFLQTEQLIETFEGAHAPLTPTDLALIFDTNDSRLLEPLYTSLQSSCKEILFIDHHPVLSKGPLPTQGSVIETTAASTGEVVFNLIKELGLELTTASARALYTSLVFDTQLFRFIRSSPNSHLMAAELLKFDIQPEDVHRRLLSTYTTSRVAMLAKTLGQIEYLANGRIAIVRLAAADLLSHGLDLDESLDVVDFIMNIETVEAAALFREDGDGRYKLSLRSKGAFDVMTIAESLGGGGHLYASGAYLKGSYSDLKARVAQALTERLKAAS